jgi:hypothetical protein
MGRPISLILIHQLLIGQEGANRSRMIPSSPTRECDYGMTKSERYLQRAEEFAAMAQTARAAAARATYEHLAWSYRQLGLHLSRGFAVKAEPEDPPEPIVQRKQSV